MTVMTHTKRRARTLGLVAMKNLHNGLLIVAVLAYVLGCNQAREVDAHSQKHHAAKAQMQRSDSDLLTTVVEGSKAKRREAIVELCRRINDERFGNDPSVSIPLLERVAPVLIRELDEPKQHEPLNILISLQTHCPPPDRQTWEAWWARSKSDVHWAYLGLQSHR